MELLQLVAVNDVEGVKIKLSDGRCDVSSSDINDKQGALYIACKNGFSEVAKLLLEHGAYVEPLQLFVASENGHLECVRLLLTYGASFVMNCRNQFGRSSVGVASRNGHWSIVSLLYDFGADFYDIDPKSPEFWKPISLEHSEFIVKLVRAGLVKQPPDYRPLLCAFTHGCEFRALNLLQDDRLTLDNHLPMMLYYSIEHNWPEMVRLLIGRKVNVNDGSFVETPLRAACRRGRLSFVVLLLQNGADLNLPTLGQSLPYPIQVAAAGGYTDICEILVHSGATVKQLEPSPMHLAMAAGNVDIVELLVDAGCDVNAPDVYGMTVLLKAASECQFSALKPLMSLGARVDCRTVAKETVLLLLIAGYSIKRASKVSNDVALPLTSQSKDSDAPVSSSTPDEDEFLVAVKFMLEIGADGNAMTSNGWTALSAACRAGLDKVVAVLLKSGCDVNSGDAYSSPLTIACWNSNDVIVEQLLAAGAHVNGPRDDSETAGGFIYTRPLFLGLMYRSPRIVASLIKHGADVNVKSGSGKRLFDFAVDHRLFTQDPRECEQLNEILCLLLQADVDISTAPNSESVLHRVCSCGPSDVAEMLLVHGVDPNEACLTSGGDRSTPLRTACVSGNADMVELLLRHGASVDVICENGQTALYTACDVNYGDKEKKLKIVGLLLEHGADVNKATVEHAKFPMAAAFKSKDIELAKLLLSKGASPNVLMGGQSKGHYASTGLRVALCVAVDEGNHALAGLLLEHGADVNLRDVGGKTALHVALNRLNSFVGNTDACFLQLLRHGADYNVMDDNGISALYQACCHQLPRTVNTMLERGKIVNRDTPHQPLLAAVKRESEDLVELLLAHGADPEISVRVPACKIPRDVIIQLPLCVAAGIGHVNIVRRLLSAGAGTNSADGCGRTAIQYALGEYEFCASFGDDNDVRHSVRHWRKFQSVVDMLLEAGSDMTLVDRRNGYRPFQLVVSSLVNHRFSFGDSVTSSRAIFKMANKLVAHGAAIEKPAYLYREYEIRGKIDEFLHIRDVDFRWIVKLFKAGVPDDLLVHCSLGMPFGDPHANCTALAQAVVLNKARLDLNVVKNHSWWRSRNALKHALFESWCEEDARQAPSLMRLCRVVIRKQLFVASGGRTIVPSVERLPLPVPMLQYLVFEGVHSEVDLTLSDDDDDAYVSSDGDWYDDSGDDDDDDDYSM